MSKIIPSLSKMRLKVISLEQSLFPQLQASMGPKEEKVRPKSIHFTANGEARESALGQKLMRILDFAEIERFAELRGNVRWRLTLNS